MVRCDRGLQMLLTTAGAFAAFSLMAIAIGTDYWLYSSAHICNGTNLTMDDGPPPRRARGDLTHSGLWRVCCIEGTAGPGTPPRAHPHSHTHTAPGAGREGGGRGTDSARDTKEPERAGRSPRGQLCTSSGPIPAGDPPNTPIPQTLHLHTHTPSHTDTMKHPETHARARAAGHRSDPEGAAPAPPGEVEAGEGAGGIWGWGERTREEGREEGEGLLGNRCQCDCYGNWLSWGGAGRGRGAPAPGGSGGVGSPELDAAEILLRPLLLHGATCPLLSIWCGGEGSDT